MKWNDKEFERFVFEEIQYVIGADVVKIGDKKIASPYILVTTKSSRKKRKEKLTDKEDEHFNRISINNVIGFFRKVYSIFENHLSNYEYVSFTAHEDSKEKRIKVYTTALEKMGFNLIYVYVCPWDRTFKEYLMSRDENIPKKKEIIKIYESLYGTQTGP